MADLLAVVVSVLSLALLAVVVPVVIREKVRRGCTPAVMLLASLALIGVGLLSRYGLEWAGIDSDAVLVVTRLVLLAGLLVALRSVWRSWRRGEGIG